MKTRPLIRLALLLSLLATLPGVTGCQNVKPWQRGTLADYTMKQDRDPTSEALNEHIWFSRETAAGGKGVGGGGCGCN
jgi:hypothetical protein